MRNQTLNSCAKSRRKFATALCANGFNETCAWTSFTKFILFSYTVFFTLTTVGVQAETKEWTIDELHTLTFPYLTTNDLYLDICKAGGYIGDVALTHDEVIQLKKINTTLKKLKAEVDKFESQTETTDLLNEMQVDNSGRVVRKDAESLQKSKKRKHAQKKYRMVENRVRKRSRRAATARPERVWDYGVIPYEISSNFSGEHHALFRRAMNHWENFTCITFVPRTPDDESYILFTIAECGCCSFVGKRGEGPQAISIGKNCDKFGIVVHELGHVVGFWHEHTRPDRDQYVDIFYRNIQQGQDYNFEKLKTTEVNSLGQSYDYASIMHYARDTFSKAAYLDTILPKPDMLTNQRPEIGQRVRLSPGDIMQTNLLYQCAKCGQTFLESSGTFASPVFDNTLEYNGETEPFHCQWRIVAPQGHQVHLNITYFNVPESPDCSGDDYLEIRDGHYIRSPLIRRLCGAQMDFDEIIVSTSNRLWLEYKGSPAGLDRLNGNSAKKRQTGVSPNVNGFEASYTIKCGGELSSDYGIIENTNYPYEYQSNSNCVWVITVPEDYQVAIIFSMFQLEHHDDCIYDFLEFFDGDKNSSKSIGRYCGFAMPPNVKSTGNKLTVKFTSDPSVEKSGFSFKFIKEFDECKMTNHGCHHKCVNTLGSYHCECDIGFELHQDGKSCEHACGGYLKVENGTVYSPNFPGAYPHKKRCVWEIEAHPQYRITLNFTHFDLEGVYTNCEYDFLKVTSVDAQGDVAKIHGTYCGKIVPVFLLTSETSHLRIEFSTDSSVAKSGFAATYFTDRDECDVDNGGCEQICKNIIGSYKCECDSGYLLAADGHHCKEGGCKFELNAPSGQILSPNYPDEYPNKKECVWHIVATPGHRLQVDFVEFEIEPHQECAYDRIEMYDGSSATTTGLGKFCGPKTPPKVLTSKNELFMVFRSDSSVQRKGFRAQYTTVCGGVLHAERTVGLLYSHASYGGVNYENKMSCDWTIVARDGLAVAVKFVNFELEEEHQCEYDYLEVFDGDDDQSTNRLIRACGNRSPPNFVSSGSALRLHFRSDDTVGAKGFLIEYYSTEHVDVTTVVTTPGPTTNRPPLEPVINERIKTQFVKTKASKSS